MGKVGKTCIYDEDCSPPFFICKFDMEMNKKTCGHKDFFPLTASEIFGTFVIISMGMIAIAGGLGGGALFVP